MDRHDILINCQIKKLYIIWIKVDEKYDFHDQRQTLTHPR